MLGELVFIQEIETMARSLRKEIQAELWKSKPDLNRLNRLQRALADLESAICNLLGASA